MPTNPYAQPGMFTAAPPATLNQQRGQATVTTDQARANVAAQTQDADIDKARQDALNAHLQGQNIISTIRRRDATPLPLPPKTPAERTISAGAGAAALQLPVAAQTAREALDLLGKVVRHPAMPSMIGMPNPTVGGFGLFSIPGTPAADFETLYKQAKGGAFLQAVQAMKGSGTLSNIEGAKAEIALNRMSKASSEAAFVAAAQDYANHIAAGVRTLQTQARADPSTGMAPANKADRVRGQSYMTPQGRLIWTGVPGREWKVP